MNIILRRPKLGRTSCKEIAKFMTNTVARRCDLRKFRKLFQSTEPKGYLFRWGCTAEIPDGYKVVNNIDSIRQVNDKTGFRRVLNEAGLCPATWFDQDDVGITYPCVVRPRVHAQGKNLYLCNNRAELSVACRRCGDGYYISAYIAKTNEYRVTIVQGRVCWIVEKTPGNPDAIAWNVAQNGRFDQVPFGDWPLKTVKSAVQGFNLTTLDFGAVDIMTTADGTPYILEINSAPSMTSPYRQECMGKCFQYIIEHGKERIPLITEKGGWRKWVHPAISEEAILVE